MREGKSNTHLQDIDIIHLPVIIYSGLCGDLVHCTESVGSIFQHDGLYGSSLRTIINFCLAVITSTVRMVI